MQIVIEIDDDDYQFIKDTEFENYEVTKHLYEAVYEGTPLPKGHGRLIDVNRANDIARETKTDEDRRIIRNFLNTLSPIIEADKTER